MTGPPLSILHVLAPADAGGLETVVRSLATGHAAMGHSVTIAAVLDAPGNAFVEDARDAGLRVRVIRSPARSFLPERRDVRELLAQERVDVLHSHGYRSDILDIGVARGMRVPSVTTLHGFSATDRKGRAYEWLQLRAARRASAIVAVSTNVAARVVASGAPPGKVHLIRNAVVSAPGGISRDAARERLGLAPGRHVGWIGRLSSEKGPDVMLAAMRQLAGADLTLSFVGEGLDRQALMDRAEAFGVARQVRFHGRIPRAAELLRAFDVVALSSRTEGTPMVVLEAMACQIPIVATRVGGIPDMLSTTEALLVDSEDAEGLAAAIRAALDDTKSSAERAQRAHARLLEQFDNSAWLAAYESLYRSIQPPERRVSW